MDHLTMRVLENTSIKFDIVIGDYDKWVKYVVFTLDQMLPGNKGILLFDILICFLLFCQDSN